MCSLHNIVGLGGKFIIIQCFYHLYSLIDPLSISKMVLQHGCFCGPKGLRCFLQFFENLESLEVFCFSNILLKVSKL
jgi:hypothetical protein